MAARKLFLRARKWPLLRWEGFVASAEMEWTSEGKEQIPRNIYELGLKTYISEPDYVLHYISFLKGLGDWTNARALFERAIPDCSPDSVAQLWDAYLEFETTTGTLAAVKAIEQRRQEACIGLVQKVSDAHHIAALKFTYLDLLPTVLSMEPGQEDNASVTVLTAEPAEPIAMTRPQRRPRTGPTKEDAQPDLESVRHHYKPSRELEQLISSLPPAVDGPVPDIERVIDVILRMDFSPEGIRSHEVAAAKERRRQRQASGLADGPAGGAKRKRAGKVDGERESDSEGDHNDDVDDDDAEYYYHHSQTQQIMQRVQGGQDAVGQAGDLPADEEEDDLLVGGDVYKRRMRAKG